MIHLDIRSLRVMVEIALYIKTDDGKEIKINS